MRIALKRRHTSAAGATHPTVSALPVADAGDAPSRFSVQQAWRDALRAYCAQPLTFALFSVIGFAGAALLGMTVSALAGADRLDAYLHATGPFPTYSALGKIEINPANPLFLLLLSQSLLGWLLGAFSCGVMAHTVVCRQGARAACHAVATRMPALLAVTMLSSLLMGFGAVGINAGLRSVALDLSNAGANAITPQGMLEKATMHAIDQSLPAVGSPFAEFVPYLQHTTLNDLETTTDYNAMLALTYNLPDPSAQAMDRDDAEADVLRCVIAGVAAIALAQSLLCFGAPAVMLMRGVLAPILRSAGWGVRFFLPIFMHTSALHGLLAGVKIIFIVVPLVLMQCLVVPQQWLPDALKIDTTPLIVVTIGIVNALFAGFLVVFESTLCLRWVGLNRK